MNDYNLHINHSGSTYQLHVGINTTIPSTLDDVLFAAFRENSDNKEKFYEMKQEIRDSVDELKKELNIINDAYASMIEGKILQFEENMKKKIDASN